MFTSALPLYIITLFGFGCAVGSFLNVVIWRLPHGVSLIHPGSRCPGCGRRIKMVENIPILSWFLLQRRCRGCWATIHWRYPGVEFLTGILWGITAYVFYDYLGEDVWLRIPTLIIILWFVSYQIAISFIDYDLTIIPDELNYSGVVISLGASYFLPHLHPESHSWFPAVSPELNSLMAGLLGMVVGAAAMYAVLLIGTLAFHKRIKEIQKEDPEIDTAIGFGDVKLMAFLGAFLGWREVLLAFLLGTVIGAVVGIITKIRSGDSVIPYGPFLCMGALLMLFLRQPILEFFISRFAVFTGGE